MTIADDRRGERSQRCGSAKHEQEQRSSSRSAALLLLERIVPREGGEECEPRRSRRTHATDDRLRTTRHRGESGRPVGNSEQQDRERGQRDETRPGSPARPPGSPPGASPVRPQGVDAVGAANPETARESPAAGTASRSGSRVAGSPAGWRWRRPRRSSTALRTLAKFHDRLADVGVSGGGATCRSTYMKTSCPAMSSDGGDPSGPGHSGGGPLAHRDDSVPAGPRTKGWGRESPGGGRPPR